jgi:hypothetical protein
MMKVFNKIFFFSILTFVMLSATGCNERPQAAVKMDSEPAIFPDYTNVTVPYNIAPLNFRLVDGSESSYAEVSVGGKVVEVFGKDDIRFNLKEWKNLLNENKGSSLSVKLYTKNEGKWLEWKPFEIYVSEKAIDSHLVYRLIEPGYEKWHILGIYQRNLENFEETPIILNRMVGYNCINCHTFCGGDPNQMMFHMRVANGGTYILQDNDIQKLNTKTDSTISNMTYPHWHPSGNYITTSVNTIHQFFHATAEKKIEVFDLRSDVVVYDIKNKQILSKASVISEDNYETFPAFSPDGKWLYYCNAPAIVMPDNYDVIRYNITRVPFDDKTGEIKKDATEVVVGNETMSHSFPRISPDGRYLMYTETAYGQFPIWHKDAEIQMIDLETMQAVDMSQINSPDTDSYHSWSSGSDWVALSSRRDNSLYTLPYFCHIGEDGKPAKPFLLPQEDPETYDYLLYSYNIPELVKGEVDVTAYQIQNAAVNEKAEQVTFK